jgi:hypothetical protein
MVIGVYVILTPAGLKVVLLLPFARKCKDELLDLFTIPLAEFFIDKS